MSAQTQSFERFELKYWAPVERVASGMKFLEHFMRMDDFGASQVNTSLYLDSPRFIFLEQHVGGAPDRIKLRVRYYGERPGGPCFFEIKRRQGPMVTKRRAILSLEQTIPIVDDISARLPVENEALAQFQYLALRCSARPVLLVRAKREAFRPIESGLDVRLTIDREVAWQPRQAARPLEPDPRRWRGISAARESALVEVKFNSARPWWLGHFTEHLAPWRVSFSKYVAAALDARKDPFTTLDAA